MAIDWLTSSNEQRAALYDAVIRLIRTRDLTWGDVYEKALGRAAGSTGAAFNENFRKGKISRPHAARLYRYLCAHHPDCIPALNAAVSTASAFWQLLLDYRRIGALEILPDMVDIPFRMNRLGPEWREFPFDATAPIEFRLRLPQIYEGVLAIGLSLTGWYPIALEQPFDYEFADVAPPKPQRAPHRFIKPVTQGAQTIPTAPPTERERRQRGEDHNFFVFLAGPYWLLEEVSHGWESDRCITNAELDFLAGRFAAERQHGWSVAQINAHGMGPVE